MINYNLANTEESIDRERRRTSSKPFTNENLSTVLTPTMEKIFLQREQLLKKGKFF
jgi:hypothetical protein